MSEFKGFGTNTIAFLRALGKNNSKSWFDAHRDDYENHYLEPAKSFVEALADPLHALDANINVEPRVNGSIFRINRDVRFSKDKTPYKDHLDLWFWQGERKTALSGLFFRLTDAEVIVGAGAHKFAPETLAKYRQCLEDNNCAKSLLKLDGELGAQNMPLMGEHYAKLPRGLTPAFQDDNLMRLARHNALYASSRGQHPPGLDSSEFIAHCVEKWRGILPLHQWIVGRLG